MLAAFAGISVAHGVARDRAARAQLLRGLRVPVRHQPLRIMINVDPMFDRLLQRAMQNIHDARNELVLGHVVNARLCARMAHDSLEYFDVRMTSPITAVKAPDLTTSNPETKP